MGYEDLLSPDPRKQRNCETEASESRRSACAGVSMAERADPLVVAVVRSLVAPPTVPDAVVVPAQRGEIVKRGLSAFGPRGGVIDIAL